MGGGNIGDDPAQEGGAWSVVPTPVTNELQGVWAVSMEDAWAVGEKA